MRMPFETEDTNHYSSIDAPESTVCIENLIHFARKHGLLHADDISHARNALLLAMKLEQTDMAVHNASQLSSDTATPYLQSLCDNAVERSIIENTPFAREQFSAHLMNLLTPLPSQVNEAFARLFREQGSAAATDWFYAFCRANDSIRVDEIAKNIAFEKNSPYGMLEVTINLSKPEKDPNEIAMLRERPPASYPACMLCVENEGYAGRLGYPSHETLRAVPIDLLGERWRFQYSPYSYYAEHCIALNELHTPMQINKRTFTLLLALVERFPHYFFGSNADLPIVGGSILNHDHFQGGRHLFPMDAAPAYAQCGHPALPNVEVRLVRWPMTCIRLLSGDKDQLVGAAETILRAWQSYSDPCRQILSESNGVPHNTLTPIARFMEDGRYMLQLVLRNNRTTDEYPLGIFHPHPDLHPIKRENIGLIEVMGLFILPGRLQKELSGLEDLMTGKRLLGHLEPGDALAKHVPWISDMIQKHGTMLKKEEAKQLLRMELTKKCVRVLEDAGVYKVSPDGDAAVKSFLKQAGFTGYAAIEA